MTRASEETRTAVYRVFDDAGNPLYYGQSHNPLGRLATHARRKSWIGDIAHVRIDWFPTLKDALDHERVWTLRDNPAWSEQGVTSYWPPIGDDPAPRTRRTRKPRAVAPPAPVLIPCKVRGRLVQYPPHELVTNVAESHGTVKRDDTITRALEYVTGPRRDREKIRALLDKGVDDAIALGMIPLWDSGPNGPELFGEVTGFNEHGQRSVCVGSIRPPKESTA